jgi:hypothetical protein
MGAALLLATMQAVAQNGRIRADIPFDFTVNKKTLAAGVYDVARVHADNPGTLLIRSLDGRRAAYVLSKSVGDSAVSDAQLLFERTDAGYTLVSVRDGAMEYSLRSRRPSIKIARTIVPATTVGGR